MGSGRLRQEDASAVLALPARRALFDIIRARPGLTVSALAERASMQWTAAHFHVLRLEAARIVRTIRVGRRRLVFPADAVEGVWPEERAALDEPSCRALARAVLDEPGRDLLELVDATGLSSRVVYHHARRLVDLGLATTPEAGHYKGLRPTPKLYALLADDE